MDYEECGNVSIRQIYSTKETVCMYEIPLILLLCECVLWVEDMGRLSRDSNGISELALIQLILPYKISCIWVSLEIPLLSLSCHTLVVLILPLGKIKFGKIAQTARGPDLSRGDMWSCIVMCWSWARWATGANLTGHN